MKSFYLSCCLLTLSPLGFAQDIQGMNFSHQDWEIYCSNTGTCQAAGYQNDDGEGNPASLLLTRNAGAKQSVSAEFALSNNEQEFSAAQGKNIHFYINGQDLGQVSVDNTDFPLMGQLSTAQVNALLQQTKQKTEIVFKNKSIKWEISDAGMTATLLKMDDFQKRVGTVGALVKKGNADESKVLAAQPKLIVKKAKTESQLYLTLKPENKQYQTVYRALMTAQKTNKDEGSCEGIDNGEGTQNQAISLYKLSNKKVLAMSLCWRGAYNEGYGAWVLDQSLTGKATFVTDIASEFSDGILSSSQKGRGIGDCWAAEEWVWDGQKFVHTEQMWTGKCRGLAAGGVWTLNQIEAVVK